MEKQSTLGAVLFSLLVAAPLALLSTLIWSAGVFMMLVNNPNAIDAFSVASFFTGVYLLVHGIISLKLPEYSIKLDDNPSRQCLLLIGMSTIFFGCSLIMMGQVEVPQVLS